MNINLMSADKVKAMLGISDATYDAQIAVFLPIVSADVRRILNTELNDYFTASYSSADATIDISDGSTTRKYGTQSMKLTPVKIGDVVEGDNIEADTYVIGYNYTTYKHTLSDAPGGTGSYIERTINIRQWPTIAKMVFYKITKNTTGSATEKNVSSKSIGSVSVSYGEGEINKQWDYPQVLIDDLGTPFANIG